MRPPAPDAPLSLPWPVALLGTGKLGEALLEGLARAGLLAAGRVVPTARRPERLAALSSRFGLPVQADNREALAGARLVVLGVRHPELPALLGEVGPALAPGQCVVSLAAGVPLAFLERHVPPEVPVVRALPSTPMAVGAGVTAVAGGSRARTEDVADVLRLFAWVGQAYAVEERHLDAIHAVVGAGSAFLYAVVEALAEAGRAEGLPEPLALALAAGTARGSSLMAATRGLPLAALVSQVARPGGATAAGLSMLHAHGLQDAFAAAVSAAAAHTRERSRALLQEVAPEEDAPPEE